MTVCFEPLGQPGACGEELLSSDELFDVEVVRQGFECLLVLSHCGEYSVVLLSPYGQRLSECSVIEGNDQHLQHQRLYWQRQGRYLSALTIARVLSANVARGLVCPVVTFHAFAAKPTAHDARQQVFAGRPHSRPSSLPRKQRPQTDGFFWRDQRRPGPRHQLSFKLPLSGDRGTGEELLKDLRPPGVTLGCLHAATFPVATDTAQASACKEAIHSLTNESSLFGHDRRVALRVTEATYPARGRPARLPLLYGLSPLPRA